VKEFIPNLGSVAPLTNDFSSKSDYEDALEKLQQQLLNIQQSLFHAGERAIILFEGTDASGKGGVIRRTTQMLDPRSFTVHAIGAPSAEEQGRHYLWRFFEKLPRRGHIAIFDRSWYGRVLVERVEGLATPDEWQRAYREICELERWLTDDGIRFIKVYINIDQEEQNKRFEERISNPRKYWKLTEDDLRNRHNWDDYIVAANDMFAKTHSDYAPWHVVDGKHKWRTRVHILVLLAEALSENLDINPPAIDEAFLKAAREELGLKLKNALPTK
jgi:AMP-polyphosphate phosphotransferase